MAVPTSSLSDHSGAEPLTRDEATPPRASLPIQDGHSSPKSAAESGDSVPSFGCIVYLSTRSGVCHGRVANLEGIEASAADQRRLLGQIVARFKAVVAESLQNGDEPKWIDPPKEKREGESKVFLPVHL